MLFNYFRGLLDANASRVPCVTPVDRPAYMGNSQEHLDLTNAAASMIQMLFDRGDVQKASTAKLFHPDLHARNIFVSDEDPTQITYIIDLQSCSVEQAWHYSHEIPDLCKFSTEVGLQRAKAGGSQSDLATRQLEKDVTICRKTWKISLHALAPELFAGRVRHPPSLALCSPELETRQHKPSVRSAGGIAALEQ